MDTNKIVNTFNENISYIQTQQPKLFSKLVALDNAVENGHYQEKYELVFNEGYFDVIEKATGVKLYGKDSYQYAKDSANGINYEIDTDVCIATYDYDISDEDLHRYSSMRNFEDSLSGLAPILYYIQEHLNEKATLKKLYKFIFFGVGLGLHIESIAQKFSSKVYFIIEDDLELFRLSLFTTNYKELAKNATLFFSVFEDENEFRETSEAFLNEEYHYNRYIKYFHSLSHAEEKINQFHLAIASQPHLHFFYNSYLTQTLSPLEYLFDDYQFLKKTISFENTPFEDKSFILVAAGPSLQKNIEWLKENQNKFVVVAVSATLSLLEKENIKPDIIVHLDAFTAAAKHFDKLKSLDFIQDSICLLSAKTSSHIVTRLKKNNVFFFENGTDYKSDSFRPSSPCVGSITYQILLYCKVKNLYLLGLDLAVDSETGSTHSLSHEYVKTLDTNENAFNESHMNYKEHLVAVEGNKQKEVYATPSFKVSIDAINYFTEILKKEFQNVFNLGSGAKLRGSKAIDIKEIKTKIIDEKMLIYHVMLKNSSVKLTKKENKEVVQKLSYAQELKGSLTTFIKSEHKSVDEFKDSILQMVRKITHDFSCDLSRVYDIYLKYCLPYIFDVLNRTTLQLNNNNYLDISDFLFKELEKILDYYINKIEFTLEDNIGKKNELMFIESLYKNKKETSRENSIVTRSIGFISSWENINDEEFMTYFKELSKHALQIRFVCFYLSDKQKHTIENKLQNELNQIKFIFLENIKNIQEEVDMFICNKNTSTDIKVNNILRINYNILSIVHDTTGKNYTVESMAKRHRNSKHHLLRDPSYFGFCDKVLSDHEYSVHKVLYEKYLGELFSEQNIYELVYFKVITELLSNNAFKVFYIDYLRKEYLYQLR